MFDPLTTNAVDLQQLLQHGEISSVQIVEKYLNQIDRYNSKINAFISLAPRDKVLRAAASLDEERQRGQIRSPLHGIPIVVKDCFVTASSLGMDTTAGAWAFVGAKAKDNGAIVQRLIDAGLLILGKTNMTEFCGMKMFMTPGRSAVSGQTLSPYVGDMEDNEAILGHSSPGGSSTGSAVAVAAGFSPLALGTETIGSIVTPANRAALYALKPTIGIQDPKGMYRMTDYYDSPGPMAKSVADLACLTEILLAQPFQLSPSENWNNLSVGFLSPTVWNLSPEMCIQHDGTAEQMVRDYENMVSLLSSKGCQVKSSVELQDSQNLTVDGEGAIMPIAFWEFRHIGLPEFIEVFENSPVRNLDELVKFNEANKEKALPPPYEDQDLMIQALNGSETAERIDYLRKGLKNKSRQILDEVFASEGLNLLAAPADSGFATYAAAAGYPLGVIPLGQLSYNKRPFGFCMIAKANEEQLLLQFMSAYEAVSAPRPVPQLKQSPP